MGFAWTENISPGALIDAADLLEIRTNVDTVDNEKCAADKTSYDNNYNDGDDAPHNPGYFNDENTDYDDANLIGYDGTHRTGYDSNEHGTYNSGDQVGVDGNYVAGYFNDDHGTYKSGHYSGVLSLYGI